MGNAVAKYSDNDSSRMLKELNSVNNIKQLEIWISKNRRTCLGSGVTLGKADYRNVEGVMCGFIQHGAHVPYDVFMHWMSKNKGFVNKHHLRYISELGLYDYSIAGDSIGIDYMLREWFGFHKTFRLTCEIPLDKVPTDLKDRARELNRIREESLENPDNADRDSDEEDDPYDDEDIDQSDSEGQNPEPASKKIRCITLQDINDSSDDE
jgi:hypothetical protein